MNLYGINYSLFDLGLIDPALIESISTRHQTTSDGENQQKEGENLFGSSNLIEKNEMTLSQHRHDGTSPLPLGMEWNPPPRLWDGPSTVWPHGFHTGWSYCVTIPSWTILSEPGGSEPVVFYRVQVGLQSPEGVTTTRGLLRRFRDFLKLASALKRSFPNKKLPTAPSKRLLKIKGREILEERRCSWEEWMTKVLSDIDISRSAPSACFLELEAAARSAHFPQTCISAFSESSHQVLDMNLSSNIGTSLDPSNASVIAVNSELTSNFDDDSINETPEALSSSLTETTVNESWLRKGDQRIDNAVAMDEIYLDDPPSDVSSLWDIHRQCSSSSQHSASFVPTEFRDTLSISGSQFLHDTLVILPAEEQQKMNRLLVTMQQRLVTSKTDMEDLMARLNHEFAVRQYLTTKAKDLEIELESTKKIGKENLEKAILDERERFTQTQWDMEDISRKCLEMELKLKAEQDEKVVAEATNSSIVQENEALRQELDSAREQLKNLKKYQEDSDLRSKSDVKLLIKEVKSLRNSQSEQRQELDRMVKEKTELERRLQMENQKTEHNKAANANLLHECEILRCRLEECSVNFLIEEENKLKMDTSYPSDAVDILATSDNRIGLLLAEAQLLAQEVKSSSVTSHEGGDSGDHELRKMLCSVFMDNAILRKHVNSVVRCSISTDNNMFETGKEEAPSRKAVLSKFLEK
ncbi:PX domain-containing protein EREX isoform X1 [Primulina huaijiensis]|uniref:PX domain-containing protein EREX isoform X1 n=1 Tax=Primulina huaijiensis TaxID=1492673 RepID=UPI003CC73711